MKAPSLILIVCLVFALNLTGQPRNAFSYISKPDQLEQEMEALVGPKYEKALAIYNRLVEAKGDRRFTAAHRLGWKKKPTISACHWGSRKVKRLSPGCSGMN